MTQSLSGVLLVEDDEGDAFLVRELLLDAGSRRRAVAGLGQPRRGGPSRWPGDVDCVLLDLGLPDARGWTACSRARDAPQHRRSSCSPAWPTSTGHRGGRRGRPGLPGQGHIDGQLLTRAIRYAVSASGPTSRSAGSTRAEACGGRERPARTRPAAAAADARRLGRGGGRYRPGPGTESLLGGDFYDVVECADGAVFALIGDVVRPRPRRGRRSASACGSPGAPSCSPARTRRRTSWARWSGAGRASAGRRGLRDRLRWSPSTRPTACSAIWRAGHPLPVHRRGPASAGYADGDAGLALGVVDGRRLAGVDRASGHDSRSAAAVLHRRPDRGVDRQVASRRRASRSTSCVEDLRPRRPTTRHGLLDDAARRGRGAQRRRAHRRRRRCAAVVGEAGVSPRATLRRRLDACTVVGPARSSPVAGAARGRAVAVVGCIDAQADTGDGSSTVRPGVRSAGTSTSRCSTRRPGSAGTPSPGTRHSSSPTTEGSRGEHVAGHAARATADRARPARPVRAHRRRSGVRRLADGDRRTRHRAGPRRRTGDRRRAAATAEDTFDVVRDSVAALPRRDRRASTADECPRAAPSTSQLLFGTLAAWARPADRSAVAHLGGAAPLGHRSRSSARRRGRPGRGAATRPATGHEITGDGPARDRRAGRPIDRMRRADPAASTALAEASPAEARRPRAARGAGRGAAPVQRRARAVRLRRLARPAGAAAQGGELLPAPRAPLRGPARRAGRPVHRVRGRRRQADAAAHQRPARFSRVGRLDAATFDDVDLEHGARDAGRAPARGDASRRPAPSSRTTRCRRSTGDRRLLVAAVPEPDRQRAQVPRPDAAPRVASSAPPRRRTTYVGVRVQRQRHRHRAASTPTRSS